MYLVLPGNEYGLDTPDNVTPFISDLDRAEKKYQQYLAEDGGANLFKVWPNKLELLKSECHI